MLNKLFFENNNGDLMTRYNAFKEQLQYIKGANIISAEKLKRSLKLLDGLKLLHADIVRKKCQISNIIISSSAEVNSPINFGNTITNQNMKNTTSTTTPHQRISTRSKVVKQNIEMVSSISSQILSNKTVTATSACNEGSSNIEDTKNKPVREKNMKRRKVIVLKNCTNQFKENEKKSFSLPTNGNLNFVGENITSCSSNLKEECYYSTSKNIAKNLSENLCGEKINVDERSDMNTQNLCRYSNNLSSNLLKSQISINSMERTSTVQLISRICKRQINVQLYDIQRHSIWYKSLDSKSKLRISELLTELSSALYSFRQRYILDTQKKFDIFHLDNALIILQIMDDLNMGISDQGLILHDITNKLSCSQNDTI